MKITVTALPFCGSCIAPRKWITNIRTHPYRLYYVRGGSAYFRVGNEEIKLQKNCFYLFPSTLPFLIRQDPDDRLDHLFYHFIMSPPLIAPAPIVCALDEHPLLPSLLSLMESAVEHYRPYYRGPYVAKELKNTVEGTLETFLNLLFAIKQFPSTIDHDILSSVEYIESHYQEDFTVRELSAHVCLDEDYFIRKFKKSLGVTPYSYLLNLRLGIAAEMRDLGATAAEAALAVGFRHPSAYYRAIKRTNEKNL